SKRYEVPDDHLRAADIVAFDTDCRERCPSAFRSLTGNWLGAAQKDEGLALPDEWVDPGVVERRLRENVTVGQRSERVALSLVRFEHVFGTSKEKAVPFGDRKVANSADELEIERVRKRARRRRDGKADR